MPGADLAAPSAPPDASPPAPGGRWRRARRVALAVGALGLLLVLAETWRVLLGSNFHVVIPGRIFRCCQPTPEVIADMVASHGIRTVVNLRGCCNPFPWYLAEARATQSLDICQEDVCFSAGRLPSTAELRRLVEVLERAETPLVLHCRRGADRTGLAAAIALLLLTDTTPAAAARQLGIRYGHLPVGRPAYLDTFLDLYDGWLRARGRAHSRATFRHWALQEYIPGGCSATLEVLSPRPLRLRRGEPATLRVRARNTGVAPWRFRPTTNAGVHVGFHIWDERDYQVAMDKCGLYDAEVAPGQSIDVTVPLPALERPGRYLLMLDLSDERRCWFFQVGSEPLEEELEVCD
jgi:predicted protein tyrosine phosphatase